MSLDKTTRFLAASEQSMTMKKRKEFANESKARQQSISDIEQYTKKNKMAFSQFEVNMASASAKLKEVSSPDKDGKGGDPQVAKIVESLETLNALNGKSNQEQKKGLAKLEGLNTQIANVNDKSTKAFLQEQADLLKEGLSRQTNLTSTIAEKFDRQADNIGGVFGAVLGNSPLAGMVTKFFIKSIREGFKRRSELKIARSDAAKDAAKAIHASREVAEAVEANKPDKVQKVEIVGQAKSVAIVSDSTGEKKEKVAEAKPDNAKKDNNVVDTNKNKKPTTPVIVAPKKPTLMDEEKRREANSGIINKASKVSKPKAKGSNPLGLIVKLLGFVLGSSLATIALKALSPLVGAVSSLVRFVPTALKGMASLIPGVNLGSSDAPIPTKDGSNPPKKDSPKPVKKKGSFLGKMLKGGAKYGGAALRGGATLLGGATGLAVGAAGAVGYGAGALINDNLLTNKDGSGKVANLLHGMLNPKTEADNDKEKKHTYLKNLNSLMKAGATPKEAKAAMSQGRLKETLQMLRMKQANKDNVKTTSLRKVDAIASTGAEVRKLDRPTVAPTGGNSVVHAPSNTVVNNNATTTIRQRPHLANSDTSFIAANMSGAM